MTTNAFGIELDTVKAYLGYTVGSPSDTSRDALLELLLASAIGVLQKLTGRTLERALYRDTFDYHPRHTYLRESPVVSVVSVSRGDTPYTPDTDYHVFKDSGRIQFRSYGSYGRRNYGCTDDYLVIDYVGGYTTLPSALVMAVLAGVQAAEAYSRQINSSGGVVKQLTVIDVGTTIYDTSKTSATAAAMQAAMRDHVADFIGGQPVIGDYLLHETERLGDEPASPQE